MLEETLPKFRRCCTLWHKTKRHCEQLLLQSKKVFKVKIRNSNYFDTGFKIPESNFKGMISVGVQADLLALFIFTALENLSAIFFNLSLLFSSRFFIKHCSMCFSTLENMMFLERSWDDMSLMKIPLSIIC